MVYLHVTILALSIVLADARAVRHGLGLLRPVGRQLTNLGKRQGAAIGSYAVQHLDPHQMSGFDLTKRNIDMHS